MMIFVVVLYLFSLVNRNESSEGSPPGKPFVLHPGSCGEEGEYIYFPEKGLDSKNDTLGREIGKYSEIRYLVQLIVSEQFSSLLYISRLHA